jgi:hypothetical protein
LLTTPRDFSHLVARFFRKLKDFAGKEITMKKNLLITVVMLLLAIMGSTTFAAYHHAGEQDSPNFLAAYPDKAGTKLDQCTLCHSGGQYESKPGQWTSLGSCMWCHYKYGYDGHGNIIDTLNDFGKDYLVNGRSQAAFGAIADLDSDGDSYPNQVEIAAIRYPGSASDDPSKTTPPYRVYTRAQLEAMPQHTQFLLMNGTRSMDEYVEYSGVLVQDLLKDAGILPSATDIVAFAPDGFSTYYPLDPDPTPGLYHVNGPYPETVFYYNEQADIALNPVDGWCDYSAPSCTGRKNLDPIVNPAGLRMIMAIKRDGGYMDPGVLNAENKLDGEGPLRLVPPQKDPGPPDQSKNASNQDVLWPYDADWDHNAGYSIRSTTMIKVEPLPAGTTDIDILEAGWNYVGEGKILIYGAIELPYSGWWYTASEAGTGISLEIQNNKLFMAWYAYDEQGRPVWFTSDGSLTNNTDFSGNLYRRTGWPLGTEYSAPVPELVGTVNIKFTSSNQATLSWTLGTSQGQKIITKFMDEVSPGQRDTRDINGWWWDPNYNGMGIFMEAQGGNIFMAWYHYRDDNSPRWWSLDKGFAAGTTSFSGVFKEWGNGPCIGCSYQAFTLMNQGNAIITFEEGGTARLTWSGPIFHLQRFHFGNMQ